MPPWPLVIDHPLASAGRPSLLCRRPWSETLRPHVSGRLSPALGLAESGRNGRGGSAPGREDGADGAGPGRGRARRPWPSALRPRRRAPSIPLGAERQGPGTVATRRAGAWPGPRAVPLIRTPSTPPPNSTAPRESKLRPTTRTETPVGPRAPGPPRPPSPAGPAARFPTPHPASASGLRRRRGGRGPGGT